MRRDHRSSIRSTRAREASVVFAITPGVHSTGCHQIHNSYSFASHDPSMSPHSKNITSTVTTSFVIDQPNVSVRPPPVMTRPRVPSVPPPFARTYVFPQTAAGRRRRRARRSFDARARSSRSTRERDASRRNSLGRNRARDGGRERERERRGRGATPIHASAETRDEDDYSRGDARRDATRLDATRRDGRAGGIRARARIARARGRRADGRMDGRRHARGRDDAGRIIDNHRRRFGRSVGRSPCDENLVMRGSHRLIGVELIDWRRRRERERERGRREKRLTMMTTVCARDRGC